MRLCKTFSRIYRLMKVPVVNLTSMQMTWTCCMANLACLHKITRCLRHLCTKNLIPLKTKIMYQRKINHPSKMTKIKTLHLKIMRLHTKMNQMRNFSSFCRATGKTSSLNTLWTPSSQRKEVPLWMNKTNNWLVSYQRPPRKAAWWCQCLTTMNTHSLHSVSKASNRETTCRRTLNLTDRKSVV